MRSMPIMPNEAKPWTAEDARSRGWFDPAVYGQSLANAMGEDVLLVVGGGVPDCLTRGVYEQSSRRDNLSVFSTFHPAPRP